LTSAAGASAQIEFPHSPATDYDYRVDLLRSVGESPITLVFPVAGQMCDWVASGQKPTVTGFAAIDGNGFDNNHTTNHFIRMLLENSERHTVIVAVRGRLANAYVDGLQVGAMRTDQDRVTLDPSITPPRGNRLGIRIGGDAVTVESADVLPVTGETTRGTVRAPTTESTAN
jgi:hypothetical protein